VRVPLVAGNWKMHKTVREAVDFAGALRSELISPGVVEVVLCPPYTALHALASALAPTRFGLGAQDVHAASAGAYTGEIAVEMLREAGCAYVIVGHSERRTFYGESDAGVRDKARAALAGGLRPIVCIGETLDQRESGRAELVVREQLRGVFSGLDPRWDEVVVAYEPVWAIGTGRHATAEQAQTAHAAIRENLAELGGTAAAQAVRILYGGSLNPANAAALCAQPDVDGGLVGGASLEPRSFARIVEAAAACHRTS
jgi:triosephosphate isomerase (TIM)